MKKENTDRLSLRRTFQDVLNSQEQLRNVIETLIKENRPLTDEERGDFIRLLGCSTFGLGRNQAFSMKISDRHGMERLGSVEKIARVLAKETKDHLVFIRELGYNKQGEVSIPINIFWSALLYHLFDVFPEALDRASAMSKEIDMNTGGEGYEFVPKS